MVAFRPDLPGSRESWAGPAAGHGKSSLRQINRDLVASAGRSCVKVYPVCSGSLAHAIKASFSTGECLYGKACVSMWGTVASLVHLPKYSQRKAMFFALRCFSNHCTQVQVA
jgi:hypothetical protein